MDAVAAASPEPESKWELITPVAAQRILDTNNAHNPRKLNRAHVVRLAEYIKNGGWRQNGEAIIFNRRGHLIDGQHRMAAIVLAGLPLMLLVVRGVAEGVEDTIDVVQKQRTVGDILRRHDVAGGASIAAIGRMAFLFMERNIRAPEGLNNTAVYMPDVIVWIEAHASDLGMLHRLLPPTVGRRIGVPKTPALLGPAVSVLDARKRACETPAIDQAARWLKHIRDGDGLSRGHPALTLRDWGFRQKSIAGAIHRAGSISACSLAWSAYVEGRSLGSIPVGNCETISIATYFGASISPASRHAKRKRRL